MVPPHCLRMTIVWVGVALSLLLPGCKKDELFGKGPGAEASVSTPSGVQSGLVSVVYTLRSDDVTQTDVNVTYSRDGGAFRQATQGSGGSGIRNLVVSSSGTTHTFVWDSGADLDEARESSVVIRVQPEDGEGGVTAAISVHNGRFLAAVENRASGRVRLYRVDVVDGDLTFRGSFDTGGVDPFDVTHASGYFLIVHQTSSDVAVLQVDEATNVLIAAEGSPFRGDGTGSKFLTVAGSHVFVANTSGGTITIFNFDTGSGKLTLNAHSGIAASGCRSLVTRSNRLYVASETAGAILIFDIASDGELLANGASPVTTGGLIDPRALGFASTRLYAANVASATICGFNFLGDGSLSPIAGSPFTVSGSGVEILARRGSKLFAANGDAGQFFALTIDSFGGLSEDVGFPVTLGGPCFALASGGDIALAATTTSREFQLWTIDSLGTLAVADSSPETAGVEVLRVALSN